MAGSEYEQVYDGDIFTIQLSRRFEKLSLACCYCSLVHAVYIKQSSDSKIIYIKIKQNNRATGQLRRYHKYKGGD